MAEVSFFFEGKIYKQKDFQKFVSTLIPYSGILYNDLTNFQVVPTGGKGLMCNLLYGRMVSTGYVYQNSNQLVTLKPNNSSSIRYDRIVIGLDIARGRKFSVYTKEGRIGGDLPTLRREKYYKEYSPATFVAFPNTNSESYLSSNNFIDTRFDLESMGDIIEYGYQESLEWKQIQSSLRIPFFESDLTKRKNYYPLPNGLWAYMGASGQLWDTIIICDNEGKTLRTYLLNHNPNLGLDTTTGYGSSFSFLGSDESLSRLYFTGVSYSYVFFTGQTDYRYWVGAINYLTDQPKVWSSQNQAPLRYQEKDTWAIVKDFISPAYSSSGPSYNIWLNHANFKNSDLFRTIIGYRTYQAFINGSVQTCYSSNMYVQPNHLVKGINPQVPSGYENFQIEIYESGNNTDPNSSWNKNFMMLSNKNTNEEWGVYFSKLNKVHVSSKTMSLTNNRYSFTIDIVNSDSELNGNMVVAEVLPHYFGNGKTSMWKDTFGIFMTKNNSVSGIDMFFMDSTGSWHFIGNSNFNLDSLNLDKRTITSEDDVINYVTSLGKTKSRGIYSISGQRNIHNRIIVNLTKGISGRRIFSEAGDELGTICLLKSGHQLDIKFGKVA